MAAEGLKPFEKKALDDLRQKLEELIAANQLSDGCITSLRSRVAASCTREPTSANCSISLWGVPLLPSKSNGCLDTILLKFLRAREFRPCDALAMVQRTLQWRKELSVDGILGEDLDLQNFISTTYMDGFGREGHPICYNVYRSFRDDGLYQKTFGSKEKRERFLRWRVQFMERGIQEFLSFKPGGAAAMVQVIDLKHLLGSSMKELRNTIEKMILLFLDNYPELVAKNIFLNVSLRYYTYHALFSPLCTSRTESKFVLALPSEVTETLLRYIEPENIPIQYGGFKRENDSEFSAENGRVSETFVKGGCKSRIEIPITEAGVTIVWDIIVIGWQVMYREEFMPDDECSYKILIQENKKLEKAMRNSFYINEPGKLVLTIENRTLRKKRIFYRSKAKPTIPSYYNLPTIQ